MFILITGANDSGKSACAERIAARIGGRMIYVATMIPQGEEGRARVEKHRRQRAGLGFATYELPRSLQALDAGADALVLLEDASNLLANVLFGGGGSADRVLQDIKDLARRCGTLIVVTIGGLSPDGWDGETKNYVQALNWLNGELEKEAGAVVEMRGGVPHLRKGAGPWC